MRSRIENMRRSLFVGQKRKRRALGKSFNHDALGGAFRIAIFQDSPSYFAAYAQALADELSLLGAQTSVHDGTRTDLQEGEAAVLVGLHRFSPVWIQELRKTRVVVAIQTEQLTTPLQGAPRFGSHCLAKVHRNLACVDIVLDWSRQNLSALRAHSAVLAVPYGFLEANLYRQSQSAMPTYDLAFIGSIDALDARRRRILSELSARYSVHPAAETGAWGAAKFDVFAQARLVLNLHVEASAVFESPRFYDVLGAGRCLLSEPVHDAWPFRSGTDYWETTILRLEDDVQRLLEDTPLRRALGAAGQMRAVEYGLDQTAAQILGLALLTHRRLSVTLA